MVQPKPLFINIVLLVLMSSFVHAQEETEAPLDTLTRRVVLHQQAIDLINRVKITGYVQSQFPVADSVGQQSFNGGTFTNTDKRFQVRGGRIKVQYYSPFNYFIQNIMQSPFQLIAKYNWYNPNTKVKGDEIGSSKDPKVKNASVAEMKYSTLGWGLAYRLNKAVKLTAYVDMVKNETSKNVNRHERIGPIISSLCVNK